MDFDDIILKTVELLEQFDDVRAFYQRKFHYVLIDEYQDTNALQYKLSSLLAGGYENICVVGDDDQSIYKFRGATIENILSFEQQYQGAQVIRLEQNYRSTQAILNAANTVISNNQGPQGQKALDRKRRGREDQGLRSPERIGRGELCRRLDHRALKGAEFQRLRDPLQDECAVERARIRVQAQRHPIPHHRRHAFLRPGRGQGYAGVSVPDQQPRGRSAPAAHHQPAAARHRRENRRDGARGRRTRRMCRSTRSSLHAKDYPSMEKAVGKLTAFTDMIEECAQLLYHADVCRTFMKRSSSARAMSRCSRRRTMWSRARGSRTYRELKSSILSYMREHRRADTQRFFGGDRALHRHRAV